MCRCPKGCYQTERLHLSRQAFDSSGENERLIAKGVKKAIVKGVMQGESDSKGSG